MAYQNVGTPKFFIDHGLWLHFTGVYTDTTLSYEFPFSELLTLNPANITNHTTIWGLNPSIPRYAPITYTAFLGHDIKTQGGKLYVRPKIGGNDVAYNLENSYTNSINMEGGGTNRPNYDGFSIMEFADDPSWETFEAIINVEFGVGAGQVANIGAISIGSTYTMPNAPNLSLTMSREYGKTKEITAYKGSSLSNTMWSKPPMWGNAGAWELAKGEDAIGGGEEEEVVVEEGTEITLDGNCINYNFQELTDESPTGFHGWHAKYLTYYDSLASTALFTGTVGESYKVSFELVLELGVFPYIDISNRGIEYDEEGQQSWIGWLTDYPITDGSQQANEGYNEFIFTITGGDPDVGDVFDTACVTFYYNVYQETSKLTISDIKIERLTDRVGRTSRTETSPLQLLSLSGRRTWDLKFSYIDDGDLWGSNQSLSTYLQTDAGLDDGDIDQYNWSANIVPPASSSFGSDGTSYWTSAGDRTTHSLEADYMKIVITYAAEIRIIPVTPIAIVGKRYRISYKAWTDSGGTQVHHDPLAGSLGGYWDNPTIITSETLPTSKPASANYIFEGTHSGSQEEITVFSGSAIDNIFYMDDITIQVANPSDFQYNILNDDSFFSQVWHKTLGGTLPFIFQPDSSNNNPDQFAICKFKENSLKATQTAHNVYDISLKIEEVW